ncbi:non-repetitive nucleoporin [Xylona heveae TC161]|uniref:Non-repetitive nucleoporin n=1 Tax=Xylona heveae (strain CBS 132557 / TC161) TaxID=1328760 RepID=A0A165ITT7_XYLHT|nr:non-repetitive nucleoporin [Xylona heveae TC161]KZF25382.1 non-repetitive nucleoporin [Xylona heveae TC161]
MAFQPQTPQRPLPGAFLSTPALNKLNPTIAPIPGPVASTGLSTLAGNDARQAKPSLPAQQPLVAASKSAAESLKPIDRASRTINDTLAAERRYPELDSYVGQGISSDYDLPVSPAWAPFQKVKIYDIPDKIFEQYNQAQVSTTMGLFAEINHAWITIDNALYLWDYTIPDADLIGYEDQANSITSVKLCVPRAGVFIPSITHVLVVATTAEIFMVGVSAQTSPAGTKTVALYQTNMSVPIRGLEINVIEASPATGRVFFAGRDDNDVYEFTYQQEEKWFKNRCAKVNHTSKGFAALTPSFSLGAFSQKALQEHVVQIVVDDTRNLLYTLSSSSTIRTFHMRPNNGLDLVISRSLASIFSNIGHMVSRSELLVPGTKIVSISPISATEGTKLHLMATTSTGCRIFLSATSSYGWSAGESTGAPTSMQVQHVKFPPPEMGPPPDMGVTFQQYQQAAAPLAPYPGAVTVDTQSKTLKTTRTAARFAPGYFFCFVDRDPLSDADMLFMSSPDSGRIARPQEPTQLTRYSEFGTWLNLGSRAEDVGLTTPPFAAASTPIGFGNELAVQFDEPVPEIAILTNTGIHTIRRRRLVDIFAATIRYGGGDEGLEGELKKFIRMYGRGETIATALAVACGQGLDISSDARVSNITEPEVLEYARKAFIEFGGKPILNENSVLDQAVPAIDNVRPSPRHEGLALYISRLVRSIWKAPIMKEATTPTGGFTVKPTISLSKVQGIQRDLTQVQEFLSSNRSFIDGLAGPEALGQARTKQEEISLQAEHRALHSLVVLISDIIEGISFVLVLFDERVEEIVLSLADSARQQVRQMTYEGLFSTSAGKDLAKELVKAIVNRNIASGSNVDTVAEALRRRCGSFCSADDVVIFKAQEQQKKASEAGANTETGRNLLNESLRLFTQVAASLSMEHLQSAVQQFTAMDFYAGAIQLVLDVAQEADRGNRALAWIADGRPELDPRKAAFDARKGCYNLIHQIIAAVDKASSQAPEMIDGHYTLTAKRRNEAYTVINNSTDEVFQTDLYDWYFSEGWTERLLEVQSPFIITYLQRKSPDDVKHADLLWKYFARVDRLYDAATVQVQLAKSGFALDLAARIEYLSRAKANASTYTTGIGRQSRQSLLHEVSDLLDVANIQDDILQRLKGDARVSPERRPEILKDLNGQVLGLTDLYNVYADQAGYHDICLLIYQAADHRNPADIISTWQNLVTATHQNTVEQGDAQPYEAVAECVRRLGLRLNLSDSTFPISDLLPMLEKYAFEFQRGVGPSSWIVDSFLDLKVPYETLFSVLEGMFYNDEAPFQGRNRRYIANDLFYVIKRSYLESGRSGGPIFGDDTHAISISQTLLALQQSGMDEQRSEECQALRFKIEQLLR